MNRRWVRLVVPAAAVLLAAVSIALVAATYAGQHNIPAWEAGHNLAPGAVITAQDVRQVSVPQGGDAFRLGSGSPVGQRTTHAVAVGDLLRPDDVSSKVLVDVPVSLKLSPPLQVGSSLDIYAVAPAPGSGSPVAGVASAQPVSPILVARGVSVVATGPPVVIQVPAEQEPLWVALASSQTSLLATLSSGVDVSSTNSGYDPNQAIQILNQLARGGTAPAGP